jgi:NAD(P)-dependent dehydrogenase (short-subunit alcohol dehydrogenase family)
MSKMDLQGRVAVVTGSGAGLGREHATMLASRGARVVVNDISPDAAAATVGIIRDASGVAVSNVSDVAESAAALVQTALDHFGRLDIVVNNAGITRVGAFAEMDEAVWWKVFDTSFRGTVNVTRAAWRHLVASGTGRLINVSSAGMLEGPYNSAYSAAKAAIWGLGNTLVAEGEEAGVQVTTLQPTAWTAMTENAFGNPAIRRVLREKLPPRAVAAFVTWLAHQDTTVYGECFQVSGDSAGRTVFSAMPRVRAADMTPEAWAEAAGDLMRDRDVTPLRTTSDSFRAAMVFADPSIEAELPAAGTQLNLPSPR